MPFLQVSITGFSITHPTYKCIGPVRALALKQDDPAAYVKLTSLSAKCDLSTEEAELLESRNIAKFMRRFFDKLGNEFSDDEIVRAAGILEVMDNIRKKIFQKLRLNIFFSIFFLSKNPIINSVNFYNL